MNENQTEMTPMIAGITHPQVHAPMQPAQMQGYYQAPASMVQGQSQPMQMQGIAPMMQVQNQPMQMQGFPSTTGNMMPVQNQPMPMQGFAQPNAPMGQPMPQGQPMPIIQGNQPIQAPMQNVNVAGGTFPKFQFIVIIYLN